MPLELNGTLPLENVNYKLGGHFTIKVASCHKIIQIQAQWNSFKFCWDNDFKLGHKFQLDSSILPSRLDLLTKERNPHFNLERTIKIHPFLKEWFSVYEKKGPTAYAS